MRVRRLTNWYPPNAGLICIGDVHEIDDDVGRAQLANGDVELVPATASITPTEVPDMHVEVDAHLAKTSTTAPGHAPAADGHDAAQGPMHAIAALPARDAISAIGTLGSVDELLALLEIETAGRHRKTVVDAIEAREAALAAPGHAPAADGHDAAH